MSVGSRRALVTLAGLATLGMLAERLDIDLYGDSRISVSGLFLLTAAIVLGPQAVWIMGCAVALSGHIGRERPFYKLVFNASAFVIVSTASAYAYLFVLGIAPGSDGVVRPPATVGAALVDFALSSLLVTLIITQTTSDTSLREVWREKYRWLLPHFVLLGFLAYVLSLAHESLGLVGILGFTAPVLVARFTMKQYVARTEMTVRELRERNSEIHELSEELRGAYAETLHAFVSALDARDTETHGHSDRVAQMSLQIGEALGIKPDSREWMNLKHGALLHDIGKIGVPDAVLRKPGPLTDDEWTVIRRHPQHGYEMLRHVRFLSSAAELVRCHHERYDGQGYPRGLAGQEIPLPARIFAVADTFDAITSERPYKSALSAEAACSEISAHSGSQFDPVIVRAFLRLQRGHRRAA
jgi:hypothetical protein